MRAREATRRLARVVWASKTPSVSSGQLGRVLRWSSAPTRTPYALSTDESMTGLNEQIGRGQLGTLAVLQGRLQEARALLDEALELSLATHSCRRRRARRTNGPLVRRIRVAL